MRRRALFGTGDQGSEPRVTAERFEIFVIFYALACHCRESMVHRLAYERQGLLAMALKRRITRKIVGGMRSTRVRGAKDTPLNGRSSFY